MYATTLRTLPPAFYVLALSWLTSIAGLAHIWSALN
jgi:hypothetical protein